MSQENKRRVWSYSCYACRDSIRTRHESEIDDWIARHSKPECLGVGTYQLGAK